MTAIVRTSVEYGVIYDLIVSYISDYVSDHDMHRSEALIRRCAQFIVRELSEHSRSFIETLIILESGNLLERSVEYYAERAR